MQQIRTIERPVAEIVSIPGNGENTRIEFLYRDASNYKKQNVAVVRGRISVCQVADILRSLEDGIYFIPEQIGLFAERFDKITEDDHPYCELGLYSFAYTDAETTADMDVATLTAAFSKAKDKWDTIKYSLMAS